MTRNRLSHILKLSLILIFGTALFVVAPLSPKSAHASGPGPEPIWTLPFPTGTSVAIGSYGLHDSNFSSIKDDRTKKKFTFSSQKSAYSLDLVLQPPQMGTSTIPATALASGTVIAVWTICQVVLVDYGNNWWAMYLHMAKIPVVSGNSVQAGSILGYPTTNLPPKKPCGNVKSDAEHVHFVFLNGSGFFGSYITMQGMVLCGHQVVELNNDPTNIILQGLTQQKGQVFTVPTCPSMPIHEYPIPTSNSQPNHITGGPDGNLWFTESNAGKIGRITLNGGFTEFPILTANSYPEGIVVGPDSNLWFTESNAGKIGQITPQGVITEFTIPTSGSFPQDITVGPDSNLWFTELGANQIGQITPNGVFKEFPIPSSNSEPWGITGGGSNNSIWFTEYGGNYIGQMTLNGVFTQFPIPTLNSGVEDITGGGDGNLWFIESSASNIGRITPQGVITEFQDVGYPYSITEDFQGNLWFTEAGANNIGEITFSGQITEFPIPSGSSDPYGITPGSDGNIWFCELSANKIGKLLRT